MNDQNCTASESIELSNFQADFMDQIVIELERRGIVVAEGQGVDG